MAEALKAKTATSSRLTTTDEAAKCVSEALGKLSDITEKRYAMPHVKLVNMKAESWQMGGAFICREAYFERAEGGTKVIGSGPVIKVRNGEPPIVAYHETIHHARSENRVDDIMFEDSFARWAMEEMCAVVASNLLKPTGVTKPIEDMYKYGPFYLSTPQSNVDVLDRLVDAFKSADVEGTMLDEKKIAGIFRSALRTKKLPGEPGAAEEYVIGMALGVMLLASNGMDEAKTIKDAATLNSERLLDKAVGAVRSQKAMKHLEGIQKDLRTAFPRTGFSRLESAIDWLLPS